MTPRPASAPAPLLVLVALVVIAAGASGCDRPEERPSEGQAPPPPVPELPTDRVPGPFYDDAALEDPRSVALAWCRYTQGPIPHWLLADEIERLVVERERPALRELSDSVRGMMAGHLPQQRAVLRFLAAHTSCEVTSVRPVDDDGAPATRTMVVVKQFVPWIQEPQTPVVAATTDAPTLELAWFRAYVDAFDPAEHGHREAPFSIVVEEGEDGLWRVDPGIEKRFAAPKRADRAIREAYVALRERRWDDALESIEAGCAVTPDDDRCAEIRAILADAAEHRARIAPMLAALRLEASTIKGTVIGDLAIPVLQTTVVNESTHPVDRIWARVELAQGPPVVCELVHAGPPTPREPLKLTAGATDSGHCELPRAGELVGVSVADAVSAELGGDPVPPRTALRRPAPGHRHDHDRSPP